MMIARYRVLPALTLALVSGAALAGPLELGAGPGTYSFSAGKDAAFYVQLGPGDYSFSSVVDALSPLALSDVWFATAHDRMPVPHSTLAIFTQTAPGSFNGAIAQLSLARTTDVYIDVNTDLGKYTDGNFNGTLTVSAVTAVPEINSPLLLLSGVALLGWLARRR